MVFRSSWTIIQNIELMLGRSYKIKGRKFNDVCTFKFLIWAFDLLLGLCIILTMIILTKQLERRNDFYQCLFRILSLYLLVLTLGHNAPLVPWWSYKDFMQIHMLCIILLTLLFEYFGDPCCHFTLFIYQL